MQSLAYHDGTASATVLLVELDVVCCEKILLSVGMSEGDWHASLPSLLSCIALHYPVVSTVSVASISEAGNFLIS